MVAPPNTRQTPLQQAAHNRTSSEGPPRRSSPPGDGPRWSGDSENTRPAGLVEHPAEAAAAGSAGAARGAGPGSVLGVLSTTPTARGPEVDDDFSPRAAADGVPLLGRQQQRTVVAAGSSGREARVQQQQQQQQQHARGAIQGGEAQRAASASPQEVEMEMWKLGLQIGSKLDAKDTVEKWCEATVLAVDREAAKVYVTYTYWAPKWDEWISIDSPCLAPAGTRTYQEGGPLRMGHRVEVLDEADQWLEADVVEEGEDGRARVHFKGYSKKFDMWVSPRGGRVRQYGPYRVVAKGGNRSSARQASLAPGQQHVRQIAQLSSRYEHYGRALRDKGLRVVPVEGDGNCLFRSVSHQVYGDDSHHRLVRARCMDYMESEAHFFEPYVEGDMAAFLRYLDVKRQNAVWGDDPEVQALCEIYDRPAEIWAYDPQLGAKTLRTFHEAAGSAGGPQRGPPRTPMRLSYYGGGHYDSVALISDSPAPSGVMLPPVVEAAGATSSTAGGAAASPDALASGTTADAAGAVLSNPEPGQLEEAALERSRRRAAEAGSGRWDLEEMKMRKDDESSPAGRAVMDRALAWSRNVFEAQFDDLDSALEASVDHMEQSNLNSLEAASRDSELVALQEEMLRTAQVQSEKEQLRDALEASRNTAAAAAVEADLLRQAIAESMGGGAAAAAASACPAPSAAGEGVSAGGTGGAGAGDFAAAKPSTAAGASAVQEQQQQDLENLDGRAAAAATAAAAAAAPSALEGGDEDEELKKVLLMSGMVAGGAWETLPAEEDDAELRLAIEASLAGD